jgi:small GTP-binding protein
LFKLFRSNKWARQGVKLNNSIIQKKICLLGDFSTGKTSLVRRFVYNLFDERYMSTLGVNISRKEVDLSGGEQVRLLIWDLSGNEKFDGARPDYIKGSSGALLVCDLSRADTVAKLSHFKNYLYASCPDVPVILIGNKVDLIRDNDKTIQQIEGFASEAHFPFKITSARTGVEVEATFLMLAQLMVLSHE